MGVVKELGFYGFSISKGKALGTKLLQAALSGFIWAYASLCQKSCQNNTVSDTLASWMV